MPLAHAPSCFWQSPSLFGNAPSLFGNAPSLFGKSAFLVWQKRLPCLAQAPSFLWQVPHGAPSLVFSDPRDVLDRLTTHDYHNFPAEGGEPCTSFGARIQQTREQVMAGEPRQLRCPPPTNAPYTNGLHPLGPFHTRANFRPTAGDVILFPPWLSHMVPSRWSDDAAPGRRVLYSFNLMERPPN